MIHYSLMNDSEIINPVLVAAKCLLNDLKYKDLSTETVSYGPLKNN